MEGEPCNTRLALGIGGGADAFASSDRRRDRQRKLPIHFGVLFPPCVAVAGGGGEHRKEGRWSIEEDQGMDDGLRPRASPDDKVGEEGGGPRKKLRLTHDQSTLLEATFRQHSILTPTQKQELAAILELRPRQVEVWFQNRRARTKLKQTEVDCELLKRCCERLTDENRRLKKELQELRAAACLLAAPLSAHLPQDTATFTVCPSCQLRVAADDGRGNDAGAAKRPRRFHGSTVKDESDAF